MCKHWRLFSCIASLFMSAAATSSYIPATALVMDREDGRLNLSAHTIYVPKKTLEDGNGKRLGLIPFAQEEREASGLLGVLPVEEQPSGRYTTLTRRMLEGVKTSLNWMVQGAPLALESLPASKEPSFSLESSPELIPSSSIEDASDFVPFVAPQISFSPFNTPYSFLIKPFQEALALERRTLTSQFERRIQELESRLQYATQQSPKSSPSLESYDVLAQKLADAQQRVIVLEQKVDVQSRPLSPVPQPLPSRQEDLTKVLQAGLLPLNERISALEQHLTQTLGTHTRALEQTNAKLARLQEPQASSSEIPERLQRVEEMLQSLQNPLSAPPPTPEQPDLTSQFSALLEPLNATLATTAAALEQQSQVLHTHTQAFEQTSAKLARLQEPQVSSSEIPERLQRVEQTLQSLQNPLSAPPSPVQEHPDLMSQFSELLAPLSATLATTAAALEQQSQVLHTHTQAFEQTSAKLARLQEPQVSSSEIPERLQRVEQTLQSLQNPLSAPPSPVQEHPDLTSQFSALLAPLSATLATTAAALEQQSQILHTNIQAFEQTNAKLARLQEPQASSSEIPERLQRVEEMLQSLQNPLSAPPLPVQEHPDLMSQFSRLLDPLKDQILGFERSISTLQERLQRQAVSPLDAASSSQIKSSEQLDARQPFTDLLEDLKSKVSVLESHLLRRESVVENLSQSFDRLTQHLSEQQASYRENSEILEPASSSQGEDSRFREVSDQLHQHHSLLEMLQEKLAMILVAGQEVLYRLRDDDEEDENEEEEEESEEEMKKPADKESTSTVSTIPLPAGATPSGPGALLVTGNPSTTPPSASQAIRLTPSDQTPSGVGPASRTSTHSLPGDLLLGRDTKGRLTTSGGSDDAEDDQETSSRFQQTQTIPPSASTLSPENLLTLDQALDFLTGVSPEGTNSRSVLYLKELSASFESQGGDPSTIRVELRPASSIPLQTLDDNSDSNDKQPAPLFTMRITFPGGPKLQEEASAIRAETNRENETQEDLSLSSRRVRFDLSHEKPSPSAPSTAPDHPSSDALRIIETLTFPQYSFSLDLTSDSPPQKIFLKTRVKSVSANGKQVWKEFRAPYTEEGFENKTALIFSCEGEPSILINRRVLTSPYGPLNYNNLLLLSNEEKMELNQAMSGKTLNRVKTPNLSTPL